MLILEVLTMASDRAHAFLMIAVSTLLRYSCVNLFLKSPSQAKVAMVEQTLADPWIAKVQGAFHYIGSPLRGFNMLTAFLDCTSCACVVPTACRCLFF